MNLTRLRRTHALPTARTPESFTDTIPPGAVIGIFRRSENLHELRRAGTQNLSQNFADRQTEGSRDLCQELPVLLNNGFLEIFP
jgi:hypothetical protein